MLSIMAAAAASILHLWQLYLVPTFRQSFEKRVWDLKLQSTSVYLPLLETKKKRLRGIKHKKPCLSTIPVYLFEEGSEEAILGYWYITTNLHHLISVAEEKEKVLIKRNNGRKYEQK